MRRQRERGLPLRSVYWRNVSSICRVRRIDSMFDGSGEGVCEVVVGGCTVCLGVRVAIDVAVGGEIVWF